MLFTPDMLNLEYGLFIFTLIAMAAMVGKHSESDNGPVVVKESPCAASYTR